MSNARPPSKSFWVCWRPKDALDGMAQLSPTEELAYRRILDMIFATDDQLHNDDKTLAWSTRAGRQWRAVKEALVRKGKITLADGFVRNAKATATCIETRGFIAQKVNAAIASHKSPKRLKTNNTTPAGADADAHAVAHANYSNPISGELRSPAAVAAGDQNLSLPEQSASVTTAPIPDLLGHVPPEPEPKVITPRAALFGEGLAKMMQMTGQPRTAFASWLGKGLKEFGDDAALMILEAIQDAHRLSLDPDKKLADPKSWVSKTVRGKLKAKTSGKREIPVEINGWEVKGVVNECNRLMQADGDGLWPGFTALIADSLDAGADPMVHVYPIMSRAKRKGIMSIESLGWFSLSINGARTGVAAA